MYDKGANTDEIDQPYSLRQGCNLSPYLFLIFIDDILNDYHSPTINNIQIPGLIFADDVYLTSLTQIGLQKKINALFKILSGLGFKN